MANCEHIYILKANCGQIMVQLRTKLRWSKYRHYVGKMQSLHSQNMDILGNCGQNAEYHTCIKAPKFPVKRNRRNSPSLHVGAL